jgi:hypothetical protein
MFRRLRDKVNDAVSNAASSISSATTATDTTDRRVEELSAMGFRQAEARHALRETNGDMTRATEWLLQNGTPLTTTTTTATAITEDYSELQHAIQASLMTNNNNNNTNINRQRRRTPPPPLQQSAASKNAGRAAATRTATSAAELTKKGLTTTHPKVQMPKRLSQHDQEDIILRCVNRVAPYSLSVDTLLRSLKTIQSNPGNRKFHTVNTSTVAFQRSLNAPGVLDLLKAVNFHHCSPNNNFENNNQILTLSHYDAAAFYLAISALEQIQQASPEYARHKALRLFQKVLAPALKKDNEEEEASARKRYISKLPSEPVAGGQGSQITVEFGINISNNITNNNSNSNSNSNNSNTDNNNDNNIQQLMKISRGFDHDDILGDVINWLGGQCSVIPSKLETGEWSLVDRNKQGSEEDYNYHRLDVSELSGKTLQYIGCWPSGRIAIVPSLKDFYDETRLRPAAQQQLPVSARPFNTVSSTPAAITDSSSSSPRGGKQQNNNNNENGCDADHAIEID